MIKNHYRLVQDAVNLLEELIDLREILLDRFDCETDAYEGTKANIWIHSTMDWAY